MFPRAVAQLQLLIFSTHPTWQITFKNFTIMRHSKENLFKHHSPDTLFFMPAAEIKQEKEQTLGFLNFISVFSSK